VSFFRLIGLTKEALFHFTFESFPFICFSSVMSSLTTNWVNFAQFGDCHPPKSSADPTTTPPSMNYQTDVSATLASLLSILSQSSKQPHSQPHVPPPLPINQPTPAHIEPVFIESDSIFDTSQWIGVPIIPWREPQQWHLPPRKSTNQPPPAPAVNTEDPPPVVVQPPTTYSHALKLVIQKAQSNDFLLELQRIKRRQHEVEEDLFEARCRIQRKYESKRKMNQLLKNLGSQDVSEEVRAALELKRS